MASRLQSATGAFRSERLAVGALVTLTLLHPAAAQTTPGTGAGFEVFGQLYSGSSPVSGAVGDGWAQGASFLGVLDDEGLAVPPFNAKRSVDENWGRRGAGVDPTRFTGSGKNDDLIGAGQAPWSWGPGGGGPRKNDITNTYFHTRTDPLTGHRWVFIAAETRSTNGDSHLDFEFNQAGIQQLGLGSGTLVGLGPDGGRTVDDFVVSIDFLGGGETPTSIARRWIGASYVDVDSAGAVFSATNAAAIAHGSAGSWKHFNTNGAEATVLQPLQLVEAGIDLTALGIVIDPCNTTATFIVKTRSSSSFSSDLKDFIVVPFTLSPAPVATASNDGPVCAGADVQLSAGPDGFSYSWSGPGFSSGDQHPLLSPAAAGEYCVTVSTAEGCGSTACTTVVVNVPPATFADNTGPVCDGEAATLLAGPDGLTYEWAGRGFMSSAQNPVLSPAVAGQYCVTATDGNGCTASACTDLVVNRTPEVSAGNSGPACAGEAVQLFAEPDDLSYAWSGPDFSSMEQNPILVPDGSGEYCVTGTDENDCSATDCTTVPLYPDPACFINGPDAVCAGSSCNVFDGPLAFALRTAFGSSPPVEYRWEVEGAATIVGRNDEATVKVNIGSAFTDTPGGAGFGPSGTLGGAFFTLFLETTSADGCTSMCSKTIAIITCSPEEITQCEGCTPGYWRQPQHFADWPATYAPNMAFAAAGFDDAFPGMTLGDVLQDGGGALDALGRHAVAALLNGTSADVNYALSAEEVIGQFNTVVPDQAELYEAVKNVLAGYNEDGCPFGEE